jgi:uncharacterized protein (DUF697 family)
VNLSSFLNFVLPNLSSNPQAEAETIISRSVALSVGTGFIPFPVVDLAALSVSQLRMIQQLCQVYHVPFMEHASQALVSALLGSAAAGVGAGGIRAIPVIGPIIGKLTLPVFAGATTYALGKVLAAHFEKGGRLDNFDWTTWQNYFEDQFKSGKAFVEDIQGKWNIQVKAEPMAATPDEPQAETTESIIIKLERLHDLHQKGILSEDEFLSKKQSLLQQL